MRNRDFNYNPDNFEEYQRRRQRGRIFFGLALVFIGVLVMLRMMHLFYWLNVDITWPLIMIVLGLFLGIKSGFRNHAWWIVMLVGVANLTPEFMILGRPSSDFVWPLGIILFGISVMLKPNRCYRFGRRYRMSSVTNPDGMLYMDVSFGGKKEVITSRDFKGGTVNASFSGVELNLVQSDFQGPSVVLELNISFSGVEIIIPSHWEIQNEINPSFGNVEDHRHLKIQPTPENMKTLILKGNCSFGNIEIKSY